MVKPVSAALFACLVGLHAPLVAFATPNEARAKQHYAAGKTAVDEEQYAIAYREFERGYALSKKPLFLFNMAECSRKLGHAAQALANYEAYVAADPDGSLQPMAMRRIAELRKANETAPTIERVSAAPPVRANLRDLSIDPASATTNDPQPDVLGSDARTEDDDTIFEDWPFWAAVGAAVIAGTVTAIVLIDGQEQKEPACVGSCQRVDFR